MDQILIGCTLRLMLELFMNALVAAPHEKWAIFTGCSRAVITAASEHQAAPARPMPSRQAVFCVVIGIKRSVVWEKCRGEIRKPRSH
jgi:hypothetical protein